MDPDHPRYAQDDRDRDGEPECVICGTPTASDTGCCLDCEATLAEDDDGPVDLPLLRRLPVRGIETYAIDDYSPRLGPVSPDAGLRG